MVRKYALIREQFMVPPTFLAYQYAIVMYCYRPTVAIICIISGHSKSKRNWKSRIREILEV